MCYNFHGPWGARMTKSPITISRRMCPKPETLHSTSILQYSTTSPKEFQRKNLCLAFHFMEDLMRTLRQVLMAFTVTTKELAKRNYVGRSSFFRHIKLNLANTYKKYWDDQAKAPYLYDPKTKNFVTYDDERSLAIKCDYIKSQGLGGAMLWELGWDIRPGWDAMHVIFRTFQTPKKN